jgi:hypothetical protein
VAPSAGIRQAQCLHPFSGSKASLEFGPSPEKARDAGENGRGRSTKTLKRASCFTPDIIGAIFAHASSTLGGGIFWKLRRGNKRKDGMDRKLCSSGFASIGAAVSA